MFRRLFFLCLGVGFGLALGFLAFRKAYLTTKRYAPGPVVDRWSHRLSQAVREGRKAYQERESVLWERLGKIT